jgi:hypothetical protein
VREEKVGERFESAARLDRGIADRWKARTRESLTHEVTKADVQIIIGPLFAGGRKLKPQEGEAIMILFSPPVKFTDDGMELVKKLVSDAISQERVTKRPITGAVLRAFDEALSAKFVSQIIFKSPGTGINYAPSDYLTVARLIRDGKVAANELQMGGISRVRSTKAEYDPLPNEVLLTEFDLTDMSDLNRFRMAVVHESTHVIQDWQDVRPQRAHEEADAFIAQGIVARVLGRTPGDGWLSIKVNDAAHHVMNRMPQGNNKDWQKAYEAVAGEMKQIYKFRDGQRGWAGKEAEKEAQVYSSLRLFIDTIEPAWKAAMKSSEKLRTITVVCFALVDGG